MTNGKPIFQRDMPVFHPAMDIWSQRANVLEQTIEVLVVVLLAFMPFVFGVVQAWSEEVVLLLAGVISILFVIRSLLIGRTLLVKSWIYVPIGVFIVLIIIQIIQCPRGVVHVLSPNSLNLRQELLKDLLGSDKLLSKMAISLYPYATWHGLRLVLVQATVFIVVLNIYRRPEQIKRLLLAISIIGGTVALLAVCQDLLGNGKIYWFFSNPKGPALSGPFVNHSHFGQFMNLSMGAALGLLLLRFDEVFNHRNITPTIVSDYLCSKQATDIWLLTAFMVLGAASVFISLTRGGILSMLVAGVLTTLLLGHQKTALEGRGWIMTVVALGAAVCVVYVGFDATYERLATFADIQTAGGGRWQMVKNTMAAWPQFALLGTGLGTYAVVYPSFDSAETSALATHAENEYVQILMETGLIGLLTVIVFLGIVLRHFLRCHRTANAPFCVVAYGLGYGMIAVAFHSLTDFGQHLPANGVLSTIFCALMIVVANTRGEKQPHIIAAHPTLARVIVSSFVMLALCLIWYNSLADTDRARRAERHWKQALMIKQHLTETQWQGSDDIYVELLRHTQTANALQPSNIHYHHWLNAFRWRAISQLQDPNTGDVLLLPETIVFAERIVEELHAGRPLCPTFGATYCVAGQIEKWVLDKPIGADHIRMGVRLAPCDPIACLSAGLLEADSGNSEQAFNHFERAIQLDPHFYNEAAVVCVKTLGRPDMVLQLAGESMDRLNTLAYLLVEGEESHGLVEQVRIRIRELLIEKCAQPEASASVHASLAEIYIREGRIEDAIEQYRQALAQEYGRVRWRYNLARTLADVGAVRDAIHEAKICLRLRPNYARAYQLIEDLSVRPEAMKHSNAP
ncbi:O-antigen ligase family protein [Planctomycetota bacterium]